MTKLKVIYMPHNNVKLVSDGDAEKYVMDYVESANKIKVTGHMAFMTLLTSQEMVINCVRIAILRGLIPHTEVEFLFEDWVIYSDKYGHLDNWPKGFCDYNDNILNEMLQDMIGLYKEDGK